MPIIKYPRLFLSDSKTCVARCLDIQSRSSRMYESLPSSTLICGLYLTPPNFFIPSILKCFTIWELKPFSWSFGTSFWGMTQKVSSKKWSQCHGHTHIMNSIFSIKIMWVMVHIVHELNFLSGGDVDIVLLEH